MQQKDKYFGMTLPQLAILAVLAGTACLFFGVAAWFALRGGLGRVTRAPQNLPDIGPTSTPWTLPSPVPTGTATPFPYQSVIPAGWSQHKTGLIEIWMPAEFEPGDPQLFNDSVTTAMHELVLTGFRSNSSLYRTLVLVSYQPLAAASLDVHLDGEVAKIPAEVRLSERRNVSLNSTEAVRFMLETRIDNLDFNDVTYVFLDGSTVWYVEYIAQINEFFEMLSVFEKSAQTFRVVR